MLIGSVAGMVYTQGDFYGATKWAVTGLAENTRLATDDGIGVTRSRRRRRPHRSGTC